MTMPPDTSNPKVTDARSLLSLVPNRGPDDFDVTGSTGVPFDPLFYSHVQGVAQKDAYWLLTHSARRLDHGLVFGASDTDLVSKIAVGGPGPNGTVLNHAGGCQRIGDYLVVPVETIGGPAASRIVFLDIADPTNLRILDTPSVPDRMRKAGAVGITSVAVDGQQTWVLAVYDDGAVDVYKSNGQPFAQVAFQPWFQTVANKNLQSFCLITDIHEQMFALGFELRGAEDWVTLYPLPPGAKELRGISSRQFFTRGEDDVHFRWGAGIELKSDMAMDVLSTGRVFSALPFVASAEEERQDPDATRAQEGAALAAGFRPHCHINRFSAARFLKY
jgi:hypothetical protein